MESVALERLHRLSRIAQINNTSTVANKRMKPHYNMAFVTYTADIEYAFLMQAQRAGKMYPAFLENRPDEVEDIACSIHFQEETKGIGVEEEVPACCSSQL
jgi:hypothetical protein